MSPVQKSRVIRALQKNNHTVGYLGDGINDAAALKDADVVFQSILVDIAKESADIILLEKSLLVLEEAVVETRRTFANIIKYIKMTASSNFGNVFSVLIASVFLHSCGCCRSSRSSKIFSTTFPRFDPLGRCRRRSHTAKWDASGMRVSWSSSARSVPSSIRDIFGHVECVPRQYGGEAISFPIGMVCRRLAHPDIDRSHDPHAAHPVHSEPRSDAGYPVDHYHGARHLSAVLTSRRASGNGAVAASVFRLAGCDLVGATVCSRRSSKQSTSGASDNGFELNGGRYLAVGRKGDLPTKAPAYTPPAALSTSWSAFTLASTPEAFGWDTDMDWRLNPVGFGPSGLLSPD